MNILSEPLVIRYFVRESNSLGFLQYFWILDFCDLQFIKKTCDSQFIQNRAALVYMLFISLLNINH